jgi:transposase
MAMRIAPVVTLSEEVRAELVKWSRGRNTPAKLVLRANIILLAADGMMNKDIAQKLNTGMKTVCLWRSRFIAGGLEAIEQDAPRSGRKLAIDAETVSEVIRLTTQETPVGQTHWSCRTMAERTGISSASVQRIWKAHNLQPHRTKGFKLSNDIRFEEKLVDVVGLYMNPPENAIVLCVDEKSQIQALDRTQKSLPIYPGRLKTMTHDYKRNGTTSLFAALNTLDGSILADFHPQHRHQEWLKFLKQIEEAYPCGDIHIICDNYATHKHERVRRWLKRRPRFQIHFTPTSGSWLNLVERWFRDLTQKCIRRGSFKSVEALEASIWEYIHEANENPEPYTWTAKPDDILAKVARARRVLNKTPSE